MDLRAAARDPWVWGQMLLFAAVGFGVPRLADRWGPASPAARALGVALVAGGLALGLAAARALGRSLTPGTAPLADASLVTRGPYARVRHPIYTGVIAVLTGYALVHGRWLPAVVVGVASFVYFRGKAWAEERKLAARHAGYPAYRARVPMLLPRLRRRP